MSSGAGAPPPDNFASLGARLSPICAAAHAPPKILLRDDLQSSNLKLQSSREKMFHPEMISYSHGRHAAQAGTNE